MKQTPLQIRYNVLVKYKFEQIADDYAIEFAEWISKLEFKEYSNGWGRIWYKDLYSTKELLEIFKKEKGL